MKKLLIFLALFFTLTGCFLDNPNDPDSESAQITAFEKNKKQTYDAAMATYYAKNTAFAVMRDENNKRDEATEIAMQKTVEAERIAPDCPKGCREYKPGCDIKGNRNASGEKIYHLPGQRYYDETVINTKYGERWFCTEQEAINNGWRKSKR